MSWWFRRLSPSCSCLLDDRNTRCLPYRRLSEAKTPGLRYQLQFGSVQGALAVLGIDQNTPCLNNENRRFIPWPYRNSSPSSRSNPICCCPGAGGDGWLCSDWPWQGCGQTHQRQVQLVVLFDFPPSLDHASQTPQHAFFQDKPRDAVTTVTSTSCSTITTASAATSFPPSPAWHHRRGTTPM